MNFLKGKLKFDESNCKEIDDNSLKGVNLSKIIKRYLSFVKKSSLDSARFLMTASSARLSSETCQLS